MTTHMDLTYYRGWKAKWEEVPILAYDLIHSLIILSLVLML